jgi:hypothetical protein
MIASSKERPRRRALQYAESSHLSPDRFHPRDAAGSRDRNGNQALLQVRGAETADQSCAAASRSGAEFPAPGANRGSESISARRPVAQSKRGYGSFRPRAAARTRGERKAGLQPDGRRVRRVYGAPSCASGEERGRWRSREETRNERETGASAQAAGRRRKAVWSVVGEVTGAAGHRRCAARSRVGGLGCRVVRVGARCRRLQCGS